MSRDKTIDQLRKVIREVIKEELGKSSYDTKSGISTTALTKDGKPVGYIKHKKTDTGLVAGGRIGPKAAKVVTAEEKVTVNIPVAALPSYKKGQQPTVINPQTGEEEIESDVSSWAKKTDENKYSLPAGSTNTGKPVKQKSALEKRFGHLKPGESASLKGDPKDVKKPVKESNTIIDKMKEKGVPTSDDKDVYKHVFGKERPRGKGSKSVEDKARAMGQMDMFTLEEWIGKLEEAGYSLQENDPYRDRNPNPEPQPGEIPQGDGGMIGYRGIPRGPAPKPDPYRDRNPNPEPQPGEIPQGGGLPHIEERYTLEELMGMMEEAGYSLDERNKEKKNTVIAKQGRDLKVQYAADQGVPEVPMHVDDERSNKELGRRHSKSKFSKVPSDPDNLDAYNPNTWSTKSLAQVRKHINKLSSRNK